jgi:hypothetical protein
MLYKKMELHILEDWHPYAVQDGLLITGQNPASSKLITPIKYTKVRC